MAELNNPYTMNKDLEEFLSMDLETRVRASLQRISGYEGSHPGALGYKFLACGTDELHYPYVEYLYVAKDEHRNNYEGVFGGTICSVFDTCMGMSTVAVSGHMVTTSDLTINFLRAALGKEFRIRIEFTHVGGRNISSIGKMIDRDSEELVATATSTFAVLKQRPTGVAQD